MEYITATPEMSDEIYNVLQTTIKAIYPKYYPKDLEETIMADYNTAILDASLAAVCIYEHRGYKTIGHGFYDLENGVKLVYEMMEKNYVKNEF